MIRLETPRLGGIVHRSDSTYDWRMVMDGHNFITKDKCGRRGEELELYIKGDLDCTDHKKPEPHMSGDSVYRSEKLTLMIGE